jgi:hypothetical protein
MIIEKTNNGEEGKTFLSILADGKFHQEVTKETEGAIEREYEDADDVKKTKWELIHDSVKGIITSVTIVEGYKGMKNLKIVIDTEVIVTGVKGSFGEDILKKLPALDFTKEVELTPYAFTPKGEDKTKKGVTVRQNGNKINNYYWDDVAKKEINGMPAVVGDKTTFDSDDWTNHFNIVRKFMVKEIEKLPVFVKTEEVKKELV